MWWSRVWIKCTELITKRQISWQYRDTELALRSPCNCDNHVNGSNDNNDNNEYDVNDVTDEINNFQW